MRILLASDGSEGALDAARLLSWMDHRPDTHVHIFTVQEGDAAQDVLAATRAALGDFPGQVTTEHAQTGSSTGGIVERIKIAAETLPADVVVTGSRGNKPLVRFFIGSVALGVARGCPCPVLIGRASSGPLSRVVVGIDDGVIPLRVSESVSRLPIPGTCAFHLVHVALPAAFSAHSGGLLPGSLRQEIVSQVHGDEERGRQRLAEAARELRKAGVGRPVTTELRHGDAATELLEAAGGGSKGEGGHRRADLLVVGARTQSAVEQYVLGSVSSRIVEQAPCSVLVVR